MPPPIHVLRDTFGIEILYSYILIVSSLMIYYGTKELYELSGYKGIKYFRLSFLSFALAYFSRSFIKILIPFFGWERSIFGLLISRTTLLLFLYFSTMAIFYLIYSLRWKKWENISPAYFHLIAFFISLIITLTANVEYYLLFNFIIFAIMLYVFLDSHEHKHNKLYFIYILLFVFWILNIFDTLVPNFLQLYQLLIYLASTTIFLLILYKVLKSS